MTAKRNIQFDTLPDGIYEVVLKEHWINEVHFMLYGANYLTVKLNKQIKYYVIDKSVVKIVYNTYYKLGVNAINTNWLALIRMQDNKIVDYYPFRDE